MAHGRRRVTSVWTAPAAAGGRRLPPGQVRPARVLVPPVQPSVVGAVQVAAPRAARPLDAPPDNVPAVPGPGQEHLAVVAAAAPAVLAVKVDGQDVPVVVVVLLLAAGARARLCPGVLAHVGTMT